MKAEGALLTSATAAAGGVTLLGGVVLGIPKAALVGAIIGTLFAVSVLPPNPDWRRWVAVIASFMAGSVTATFAAPIIDSMLLKFVLHEGAVIKEEAMLASAGITVAFSAQAVLSWVVRKFFGGNSNE